MSFYIEETEHPQPFAPHTIYTFDRIKSKRSYGVELEFNHLSDWDDVEEVTDATHFGSKEDCSTDGGEFVSPILTGDQGLEDIETLCKMADGFDWVSDHSNCGLHLHMDMRSTSFEDIKKIILAYYYFAPLFQAMVLERRVDGSYCRNIRLNRKTITQATEMSDITRGRSRYEWFNVTAYSAHETLEVRLLEGTHDPAKIADWINLNLAFCDAMQDLTIGQITYRFGDKNAHQLFTELKHVLGDSELNRIAARCCSNGSPDLNAVPA